MIPTNRNDTTNRMADRKIVAKTEIFHEWKLAKVLLKSFSVDVLQRVITKFYDFIAIACFLSQHILLNYVTRNKNALQNRAK